MKHLNLGLVKTSLHYKYMAFKKSCRKMLAKSSKIESCVDIFPMRIGGSTNNDQLKIL